MEQKSLNISDIKTVILSRGRSNSITSDIYFPYATLVVPESELHLYQYVNVANIVTTPDDIIGIGKLRNWALDNFDDEVLFMVDDDCKGLWVNCQKRGYMITDPELIRQIIYSNALCAYDLGISVFGFSQCWDVRKYKPYEPFKFNGWVGGFIGVIGRKFKFWDKNKFKVDIDFCLTALLKDRLVWKDNRFSFVQHRDRNSGGNSLFRTEEEVQKEIQRLKAKWGKHFVHKYTKSGESISLDVVRRQ